MNPEWKAANPKEHHDESSGTEYKGYYDKALHGSRSLAQRRTRQMRQSLVQEEPVAEETSKTEAKAAEETKTASTEKAQPSATKEETKSSEEANTIVAPKTEESKSTDKAEETKEESKTASTEKTEESKGSNSTASAKSGNSTSNSTSLKKLDVGEVKNESENKTASATKAEVDKTERKGGMHPYRRLAWNDDQHEASHYEEYHEETTNPT